MICAVAIQPQMSHYIIHLVIHLNIFISTHNYYRKSWNSNSVLLKGFKIELSHAMKYIL